MKLLSASELSAAERVSPRLVAEIRLLRGALKRSLHSSTSKHSISIEDWIEFYEFERKNDEQRAAEKENRPVQGAAST